MHSANPGFPRISCRLWALNPKVSQGRVQVGLDAANKSITHVAIATCRRVADDTKIYGHSYIIAIRIAISSEDDISIVARY